MFLDIKEGLTFLVNSENEEDLNKFSTVCRKEENTWIVYKDVVNKDDNSSSDEINYEEQNLERKIVI